MFIDIQAAQEAARTATGTGLLDGLLGGGIAIALLRIAEALISKWVPSKRAASNSATCKPGESQTCRTHGEDIATLKEFKASCEGTLALIQEDVRETRSDVKDLLGRVPKA